MTQTDNTTIPTILNLNLSNATAEISNPDRKQRPNKGPGLLLGAETLGCPAAPPQAVDGVIMTVTTTY